MRSVCLLGSEKKQKEKSSAVSIGTEGRWPVKAIKGCRVKSNPIVVKYQPHEPMRKLKGVLITISCRKGVFARETSWKSDLVLSSYLA